MKRAQAEELRPAPRPNWTDPAPLSALGQDGAASTGLGDGSIPLPFERGLVPQVEAAKIDAEVAHQLYTGAPAAIGANLLCGGLCAYAEWAAVPSATLLAWCAFLLMVTLARTALVVAYHRERGNRATSTQARWLTPMRMALVATGIVWGAAGVLLYPPGDFLRQMILTAVLAGVTAAVVISSAADLLAAGGFALCVILPFSLYALILGGDTNRIDGALGFVYLGFILESVRRVARRSRQNIDLRFHGSARADALKVSVEQYRLLLNHLPVGVLHYDKQYRVTYYNLQLATILQSSQERLLGCDLRKWNDPLVLTALRKALEEGVSARCEGMHEGALGQFHGWFSLVATPSRDSGGAINGGIAIIEDITERRAIQDEISRLVFTDSLTGLPNRLLLVERLQQARESCSRNRKWGALLLVDLDNFKALNDTRGHDLGDALLQQVGKRLASCVRANDSVARFGGDEFLLLLESLPGDAAQATAAAQTVGDKIINALNQPYMLGAYEHYCTASIGVTVFGARSVNEDELLKQADMAMYQAKAAGRNKLCFFDPQTQSAVTSRSALEADLRVAQRNGELVLHYQPVLDGSGKVVGAESLIRWIHPVRGMVSPADFIPVAEETGLIIPVGRWVLETACRELALWAGHPVFAALSLAVNVSARQLRQDNFVTEVLAAVRASGAPPKRLKLELTESVFVGDVEDTIAKMTALAAHGIGFSLDDFGTGFSSLSYLKRLPLDQLKIDKSFVSNLESDERDASICAATIGLAHNLGLKVVAEGVETDGQRHFLTTVHHCDYLQGYFYSRPVPRADFVQFVKDKLRKGDSAPRAATAAPPGKS